VGGLWQSRWKWKVVTHSLRYSHGCLGRTVLPTTRKWNDLEKVVETSRQYTHLTSQPELVDAYRKPDETIV
jgi:hypothetical protein